MTGKSIFPFLITCLSALLWNIFQLHAQDKSYTPVLVIHGGAGNILPDQVTPEKDRAYRKMLNHALDSGYAILHEGGSSLEAVTAAIVVMENSPLFNAGKGSVFTANGKNEMDASIMEGKSLHAGSVASTTIIKNPILAAKAVMENSEHVFLSGAGADLFAQEQGLQIVDPSYFNSQSAKSPKDNRQGRMDIEKKAFEKFGTVGAVALDQYGNLAAGTSTGGMSNKKYGRIGDSPIIGAGTYANNSTCAVSCTGHGEFFIRLVAAHRISTLIEDLQVSVKEAGNRVIMDMLPNMGGQGGAIILDNRGNVAMPFNTKGMFRGIKSIQEKSVWLYRHEN